MDGEQRKGARLKQSPSISGGLAPTKRYVGAVAWRYVGAVLLLPPFVIVAVPLGASTADASASVKFGECAAAAKA